MSGGKEKKKYGASAACIPSRVSQNGKSVVMMMGWVEGNSISSGNLEND